VEVRWAGELRREEIAGAERVVDEQQEDDDDGSSAWGA